MLTLFRVICAKLQLDVPAHDKAWFVIVYRPIAGIKEITSVKLVNERNRTSKTANIRTRIIVTAIR